MNSGQQWGDDDEDLPPRTETAEDENGVKTITEYKFDEDGQQVKVTRQVRVVRTVRRLPKRAIGRKERIIPFGAAKEPDNKHCTVFSKDDVFIEDPKAILNQEEESAGGITSAGLNSFWQKQQMRRLQREQGIDTSNLNNMPPPEDDGPGGGGGGSLNLSSGAPGKYVPPKRRADGGGGSSQQDDRENNTVRVTNVSGECDDIDLRMMFEQHNLKPARVFIARDKETNLSRGFAFVSFNSRDDAERAIEQLNGFGFHHLILKLDWAKPSAPRDPGSEGGLSGGYVSGYGKALAQDTKERYSTASNLTR